MTLFDRVELFCQAILDQGRADAERILHQAREQSASMVARAEKERQAALELAQRQLQAQAQWEARAVVDRANLESKRRLAQARGDLLTRFFREAQECLLTFRKSPDYIPWLHRKLAESIRLLGGDRFQVRVHPEENRWLQPELLESLGKETAAHLELAADPDLPRGGFILSSAEARVQVDQTFQGLLRQKEERLRTQLARRLWES
jgi:V/A-type H+-transporting ATPase subunit E